MTTALTPIQQQLQHSYRELCDLQQGRGLVGDDHEAAEALLALNMVLAGLLDEWLASPAVSQAAQKDLILKASEFDKLFNQFMEAIGRA